MNYVVEQRPQSQPAACCMMGIHEDEWFIRIMTPDAFTGSLLISKTAFEQMAREQGFVPADHNTKKLRELKERQDDLGPLLSDLLDGLSRHRSQYVAFEETLRRVEQFAGQLESIGVDVVEPTPIEPVRTPEPAERPAKSALDSQLAGISAGKSRRPQPVLGEPTEDRS